MSDPRSGGRARRVAHGYDLSQTNEAKIAAGGKLVAFWITHEHGDHVMGLGELAPKVQVPILAHAEAKKALAGVREHWDDWRGDRKELPPPVLPTSLIADGDEVWDLPEAMVVFPGHGDRTTIGHEKKTNWLFQDYVRAG